MGELLRCIRSVNALKIMADFGKSCHTASSEPFFYDQGYQKINHTSPIPVDNNGRCVIAEEEGERDAKTKRPIRWKCTLECKQLRAEEANCIMEIKQLFDEPVQRLREDSRPLIGVL